MIAKISRFSIFINILSICTLYTTKISSSSKQTPVQNVTFTPNKASFKKMVNSSEDLLGSSDNAKTPLIEKQGHESQLRKIKAPAPITTNNNSSPSKNSPKTTDHFFGFDNLQETDLKEINSNPKPATHVDMIGFDYQLPILPAQTAKEYTWTDNLQSLKKDISYLIGLINNGTYDLAYSGSKADPNIVGRNSTGLAEICSKIVSNQISHRQANIEQLQQHRRETTDLASTSLLLLFAINKHTHPKKIDAAILEEQFCNIQKEREANNFHVGRMIKEWHELDEFLKKLQNELSNAHLTGNTSIPTSARETFESYACNAVASA